MDIILVEYLSKMLELEERGYVGEAIILADKICEAFLADREIILLEKGKLEFRNGYERDALIDLIKAYEIEHNDEIYQLILEAYYSPNKLEMETIYLNNQEMLKEYPYYRNDEIEEEQYLFPIWQDDELLICMDTKLKTFGMCKRIQKESYPKKNYVLALVNELWMDEILLCEDAASFEGKILDLDSPMYLIYDKEYWMLFVQLYDLYQLIVKKRIVFLIDEQSCRNYFYKDMIWIPDCFIYNRFQCKYEAIFLDIIKGIIIQNRKNYDEMIDFYKRNKDEIIKRIKVGTPKILFITSRFTTIVQYHTRDCIQAVERLGCRTKLLIEQDNIGLVSERDVIKYILEFKPDIVFSIDHLRVERTYVPDEVVWICWVQDPMLTIMSKETPKKLASRDIIMNHFITWKKFKEVGYDERYLIEAPIPANSYVYKPYKLTDKEYEEYGCEICLVCHASDADEYIYEQIKDIPDGEFKNELEAIYKGYQVYVYETGNFFYTEEEFVEYIKGSFRQHLNIILDDIRLKYIASDMYNCFNQRVFRVTLVDWILEAGFTNIKLWGNGWKTNSKYEKYAMGPAKNGEILSKIYQASKIVIGNNIMTTSAARAWESMLSGAFYMSNYIPPQSDATDIRKIVKIDEELIMFYDKKDLLQKIDYYLLHEEERQKMIEIGRKVALERMTFDTLMKRVLKEIPDRLEQLREEKIGE